MSWAVPARRRVCVLRLGAWLLVLLLLAAVPAPVRADGEWLAPARRGALFAELFELPLEHRILPAPDSVLDLVWLANRAAGVDFRPNPAPSGHPLIPTLQRVMSALPEPVYRLASRHLAAIFVVENNFGSGRAEGLWDATGHQLIGGHMVLNLGALAQTANGWASMRENSAFHDSDGNVTIEVVLETPESDTVENALRFIVLHELGHVLGMGLGVHGHWAVPSTWGVTRDSAFTAISWHAAPDGVLWSPARQRYPLLRHLQFYRFEAAPLSRSVAPGMYRQLARTDFPSLYGTLDPYEDFAETFAIYVHTQLLREPYRVTVRMGEQVVERYHSCVQTGTCLAKTEFIERLLAPQRYGR